MDMTSVVREFLEENRIRAVRTVEISYRYHAEMEKGSRLSGCEIVMRAAENAVFVRAELPVSVRVEETRGVAKYLADLNKKRLEEDEQGYFDLDYAAGRIFFTIRVRQTEDTGLLKEVADFCIMQLESESEALLRVVCEECEAARQEEEERRRRQEKLEGEGLLSMLRKGLRRFRFSLPLPSFLKRNGRTVWEDMDPFEDEMEDYGFAEDDYACGNESDAVPRYSSSRFAGRRGGSEEPSGRETPYGSNFSSMFSPRSDRAAGSDGGRIRPDIEIPAFLRRRRDDGDSPWNEQDDAPDDQARNSMTEEEFEEFIRRHVRKEDDMPAVKTDPPAEADEATERDAEEMEGEAPGEREECVPHPAEEDDGDVAFPEEEDQSDDEETDEYPPLFFGGEEADDFGEPDEYDPEDEEEASAPSRAKQNVIILPASLDGAEEAKEDE